MKKRVLYPSSFILHPSIILIMTRSTRRNPRNRIVASRTRRGRTFASEAAAVLATVTSTSKEVWTARRPKLVAAIAVAACIAVLIAFFNLDLFYVFDFDTVGLQYVTKAEIARASDVVGYNVFFIDPHDVENALTRLPEVQSARVTVQIPNYLIIAVQERQPDLIWLRGSEVFWVDAGGIAVKARANLAGLTVVRDLDQSPVQPGEKVNAPALAALQALRAAWPDGPRSFEWSAARGLAFTDERGWKTYLGDASEMAGKLAVWRALVARLVAQKAQVRFIDLGKGDPYYQ